MPAPPTPHETDPAPGRIVRPAGPRKDRPSKEPGLPGVRPSRQPATRPLRRRVAASLGAAVLAGGLLSGCALLPSAGATPAEGDGIEAVVVTSTSPDAVGAGATGIVCPDVAVLLTDVPAGAQALLDRELAALDNQVAEANERLVATLGQGGPNFAQNAILGPLEGKRAAVLDRIRIAVENAAGAAPEEEGLADLAACTLTE